MIRCHNAIRNFMLLGLLHSFIDSSAQFLSNPSFEGQRGTNAIPPGWSVCELNSTPDTQPGAWGETQSPSDGNSFTSLVGRADPSPYAGYCEDIQAVLLKPLLPGKCYIFRIDLCVSTTFVNDFDNLYYYTNPLILKIFGNADPCTRTQLLYETAPVSNTSWQTHEFVITPTVQLNHLQLKTYFAGSQPQFASMLIDNIRLTDVITDDYTRLDTIVDYGAVITLSATTGTQFSWLPSEGLSCSDCQSPETKALSPSVYSVEIVTSSQCKSHKEVFNIRLRPFIPNVITPDGDGFNDQFRILGLEPNSSLLITNRVGEVMYQ
jgi:hypothetical protein